MSDCGLRESRVHRFKRVSVSVVTVQVSALEQVIYELGHGAADRTKRRYRAHCLKPSKMTRTTVMALDRLAADLKYRGATFYQTRIDEIKRLIRAAPYSIKVGLKLDALN